MQLFEMLKVLSLPFLQYFLHSDEQTAAAFFTQTSALDLHRLFFRFSVLQTSSACQTKFAQCLHVLGCPKFFGWLSGSRCSCQFEKILPDYDYFSSLHDTQRTDSAQDSCEFVFEMCFKSIDRKSHALQNPTLPPHCRSVPAPKVEEQADLLLGSLDLHPEEQQLEDHHGQSQCSPGGQALPHLGQEGWRSLGLTEIWKVPWILSDLIMFRSF